MFLCCLLCVSCTDNLQRSEFVDTPFMREGWVYVDGNDSDGRSVVVSSSSTGWCPSGVLPPCIQPAQPCQQQLCGVHVPLCDNRQELHSGVQVVSHMGSKWCPRGACRLHLTCTMHANSAALVQHLASPRLTHITMCCTADVPQAEGQVPHAPGADVPALHDIRD